MMNCETAFSHTSMSGRCLSVCRGSEGSSPLGTDLRVTDLYTAGWFDPDHDAVMRIGGEAPGGGPILSVGIKCQVRIRHPATSDRQFGSRAEQPARATNLVLSAMLVPVSRFTWLDVRRRPPMAHQW